MKTIQLASQHTHNTEIKIEYWNETVNNQSETDSYKL